MRYFSRKKDRDSLFRRAGIALLCAVLSVPFAYRGAQGAITSVTLVPAAPTVMSTGQGFYLAAKSYTFSVNVVDPLAVLWTDFSDVRLTIPGPGGGDIVMHIVPTGLGAHAVTVDAPHAGNVSATAGNIAGSVNNFTATFTFTINWVQAGGLNVAWGLRNIGAQATSSNTLATTVPTTYGICANTAMFGFSQDGDAADGYVSTWHAAFNVTGYLVYNIAGAGLGDSVSTVSPGEVTGTNLLLDGAAAAAAVPAPLLTYNIGAGSVAVLGLHNWTVQSTVTTAVVGGPLVTATGLTIRNDRVQVTNVELLGGGGLQTVVGPPHEYYQSVAVGGAQIRVTAQMQSSGTGMVGNTTVVVRDITSGINYNVLIANGVNTGVANIAPYPPGGGAGTLTPHTYRAESVSGGATENGQNVFGLITQPANSIGRWDDQDPPGASALPFTPGFVVASASASSVTLAWTALANADPDRDFYSYRIYYKKTADAVWLMVDRNTLPPATYGPLGGIGLAGFSITGLEPLTSYDFRLSAVDVFGNEVAVGNQPTVSIATAPLQIDVTVTDGIVFHYEPTFDNGDPAAHPLRETAIKVSVYIVTAGAQPDAVNVIAADNASDVVGAQFGVTGTNDDILTLADGVDRWTFPCAKVGPNTWETYLPTTHPLIKLGTNIRFIVDLVTGGVASHNDHTDEAAPPGDYLTNEWRVSISQPVLFIPWPTRILNNVMTKYQPCCYPAFYLPFDSLVTIKVYDIKGRVVAVLMDRQYRRGGQNIKEGGWCGLNKENRKVGPGLYYIKIRAVTFGGKVLIDKTKKVVVRW